MARRLKCSGVIFGFIPAPPRLLSRTVRPLRSTAGRPTRPPVHAVCLPAIPSAYCHRRAGSSAVSPAYSFVAFDSSDRTFLTGALPRWDPECKLFTNAQRAANDAADANGGPLVKLGP